jgi:aldose 1-epimerase
MTAGSIPARVAHFGTMPDGQVVEVHTLANAAGMEVAFLNLGGIICAVKVPDRHGVVADVTPGYDRLSDYLTDTRYFGAIIGRYANRIARGRFVLDDARYQLSTNDGPNHLHGGPGGFHRAIWTVDPFANGCGVGAVLSRTSPAGEEGFPGTLDVRVTYTLTDENELCFDYAATTDHATPVNLTQHSYFNLAGHASGDILDHELTVNASSYLPVDAEIIPTGEIRLVQGTHFDFRTPRAIRADVDALGEHPFDGYDHSFVLDATAPGVVRPVARLYEPRAGRSLEIETTEPGLQLYSGSQIGRGLNGKDGWHYGPNSALALETQHFPNSPNEGRFPSTILRPGSEYRSRTIYRFATA